jgi:hypothetical protein
MYNTFKETGEVLYFHLFFLKFGTFEHDEEKYTWSTNLPIDCVSKKTCHLTSKPVNQEILTLFTQDQFF